MTTQAQQNQKETEKAARAVQKDFLSRMQAHHRAEADRYGRQIDELEPLELISAAARGDFAGL